MSELEKQDVIGVDLFVAFTSTNDDMPSGKRTEWSAKGEEGEPVRFISVNCTLDLEKMAEVVNRMRKQPRPIEQ